MKKNNLLGIALLGLSMTSLQAETVVANLGNSTVRSTINTQGFSGGIDAANFGDFQTASGTTSTFTFEYDLSGLGLGGVDTLEIAVTGSANLNNAASWGLAVEGTGTGGTGSNSWYDLGETLSFTMAIKDSGGTDVTADLDTFSLTGFSVKGANQNLNGNGDPVTTIVGGQSLNLGVGAGGAYRKKDGFSIDLSSVGTPYTINSARSGQNDILQFGQLQFEITSSIPEPSSYALLGGLLALGCVMLRRRK